MTRRAAFVYDDVLAEHVLSETHPLRPVRLRYTYELLKAYGAFESPGSELVKPRMATEEEILRFHTFDYVRAVRSLSRGESVPDADGYNFGQGDNPAYEGVYEAAAWSTGARPSASRTFPRRRDVTLLSLGGGAWGLSDARAKTMCRGGSCSGATESPWMTTSLTRSRVCCLPRKLRPPSTYKVGSV